jgi:phenylacetate-CoA ligase
MYAAGLRSGDLIQNCFPIISPRRHLWSKALRPARLHRDSGGYRADGNAGAGNGRTASGCVYRHTEFLKIILEKAADSGADISSIKKALVGAEALPPSLRQWLKDHGVPHVLQMYASADIGNIAYETMTDGVLNPGMVLDEEIILEIVRPGTGDPVAEGEVGEIVVTSFNPDYPLIRFATGDMSAILPGISPCGRTNQRIKGWMGRADQTTKVKGMFVHPSQIAEVVKRHPQVQKRVWSSAAKWRMTS